MLTENETQIALEHFFNDCVNFWKGQGYEYKEAFELAIEDTIKITTDPFSPHGDKLDVDTKEKFIYYREMDLGRRSQYEYSCLSYDL